MSLKDNALIVSLVVNKPQMTKVDAKGTNAAERANNASNAGEYRKKLYPSHLTAPIRNIESAARSYMERHAYQWARGEYLLPSTRFIEFMEGMGKYELQFDQAVTAFMQNWVNVLDDAQRTQGDMFDGNDYPDVTELRRRYNFEVLVKPVTDGSDFRVQMQEDEIGTLKAKAEKQANDRMNDLLTEPLKRLRTVISRLNETMGKDDRVVTDKRTGMVEAKSPIFRDSVCDDIAHEISLLYDFMEVMPANVASLALDVAAKTPTPDELRNSKAAREKTEADTSALLATIDSLLDD
jgi:hypothetical protein